MTTEVPTTAKPAGRPNQILSLSFNQDFTALAMGTTESYALFSIHHESRAGEIHSSSIKALTNIRYLPYEEVIFIEQLFDSSLLAIVTRQEPRKLRLCHLRIGSEILPSVYPNDIRAVKMNRKRLVVCLEESIFIHDMSDMKLLHSMRELPVNPDGLCALSPNSENPFLAYPGSSITGEIQLFNTKALKPTLLLSAHEGPLAAIAFDSSGTRIASASTRGTVIRVHHAVDGTRLHEFRRSARRMATIYSLAFSPDATFLAASGNTGTIHVFRLLEQSEKPAEATSTWMGTFSQMLGGMIPKQTAEVLTQERAFASVHQVNSTAKTLLGLNTFNQTLKLFVVGYDGIVHIYEVNTHEGGECKKTSQHMLLQLPDASLQQLPTGETKDPSSNSVQRRSSYPSNTLRSEDKTHRVTPVLTNEQPISEEIESFQTMLSDDSNQSVPT